MLHVHCEAVDLHPVNLIASECAGQRVDADILGFDVARSLNQAPIKGSRLDLAALAGGRTQGCVFAQQAFDIKAALDKSLNVRP